jgi:hypothetical protein
MRHAAAVLVASACSTHVYSPPARPLPLESSATLPAGRTSVGGEIGKSSAIFGPDLSSQAVRVRHGFGGGFEVSADGSHLHVDGTSTAGVDQNAYAGALGAKINLGTKHLALTASTGYGTAATGRFTSNELGVIAAFENRYFVPFISLRAGVSVPIDRRSVDTSSTQTNLARLAPGTTASSVTMTMSGSDVSAPDTTMFRAVTIGFKIPLQSMAIYAALAGTTLSDRTDSEGFLQAGLGVEVTF